MRHGVVAVEQGLKEQGDVVLATLSNLPDLLTAQVEEAGSAEAEREGKIYTVFVENKISLC